MEHEKWQANRDRNCPEDAARLLATVPEWFGQPDSNAAYIRDAQTLDTWTVRNERGEVLGLTLVSHHFQHVSEVHLTVVSKNAHGCGIGTAMLQAIEVDARHRGVKLLEVKTLGPSHPDRGYAQTRRFYKKFGFLPLEETDLWGAETPCLIMVKPLTS
ncbi:N-acetyltransferase [Glutamicibacter uratoxydans]|uniref:N-acetyltransferase n=1 Tax=Glutamicibacter uratoxydans TaxID=43667 RepID=A0A4Y4DVG3_GLUUR|nr:GNAT family N-acetyltransferase [Glutamicibacter uratoxydans]GED07595.1 N-acetyltransferase [Glutamicibacter uratoxydans]